MRKTPIPTTTSNALPMLTRGRREKELTALFKRLYEDNVLGRIPDEQYRILSSEYTQEQAKLKEEIPALEQRLENLKDSLSNVARFV